MRIPSTWNPRLPTGPLALAVAAWLGGGCGSSLSGPTLAVTDAAPRVVCAGKPTSTITLTGTGLGPVPIGALGGMPPRLAFPRVAVQQIFDLTGQPIKDTMGNPVKPAPVKLSDDPAHPDMSHVSWLSATAMAINITSDRGRASGI
jgi:hypothetical protein